MDINQVHDILNKFNAFGVRGIVYGGALRDIDNKTGPIKDIDIAVSDTDETITAIDRFYEAYGTSRKNQYVGDYGNFPDVALSVQMETTLGVDVNFVVPTFNITLEEVAERCDFGICQIADDGEREYMSGAYVADWYEKTFTYLRSPFEQAQFDRSLRLWERLKVKFPGWRLNVPGAPHLA